MNNNILLSDELEVGINIARVRRDHMKAETKSINTKLFVFRNLKVAISTAALRSSGYQHCRRLTVYFFGTT